MKGDAKGITGSSARKSEIIWQKGEVIGSGSFGQVYGGMDLSTGDRIAVKEVNLGQSKKDMDQAHALQMEIEILSELDHPNIIKYLGGVCVCVYVCVWGGGLHGRCTVDTSTFTTTCRLEYCIANKHLSINIYKYILNV